MHSPKDSELATVTDATLSWGDDESGRPESELYLTIAWSFEEPQRVGEATSIALPGVIGRGPARDDDPAPRATFQRQRPGGVEDMPPLASTRISRIQFVVEPAEPGKIRVQNLGRGALFRNGEQISETLIGEGDTLTLKNAMVLLVERRPKCLMKLARYTEQYDFEFGRPDPDGMVGESAVLWQLRDGLAFAAEADHHVLLLGHSGVGKELAARAVHRMSPRGNRPLVARSAATFPTTLIDAELFGTQKNYPNVGSPERVGLIGQAHGSNLLLDEIGELPSEQQAHLLRVLDRGGEYQRLGDGQARHADFRLYAATNRGRESLKHDFLARFETRLKIPGLNDRRGDIPLLLRHLVQEAYRSSPATCSRFVERRRGGAPEPRVSPRLIQALLQHNYTSHMRELARVLWVSISTSQGGFLALTEEVREQLRAETPDETNRGAAPTREQVERALKAAGGSRAKAADMLGLKSRYALYRVLKKQQLQDVSSSVSSSRDRG